MAIAEVDFKLPWVTTVPRGPFSCNTLHFDTRAATLDAAAAAGIAAIAVNLYLQDDIEYLSVLLTGDAEWAVYDAEEAPPRVPINFGTFPVNVGTSTLPAESSITLGFRAPREVGVPRQRARGRVSLGPLTKETIVTGTGLLTDAVRAQVATAVDAILTQCASANIDWVVGSAAHGFNPIDRLTITNELGNVHRRQLAATAQTIITV